MQRKPHGKNLRKGRFSEPNRIYLITTVTENRIRVFEDFHAARGLVAVLRQEQCLQRADTLAYVIMPDHLHWLMELGHAISLSGVVGAVKSVSAHRFDGIKWQAGFYDHAVRKEEDLQGMARYLVANPLRAGLVAKIGDYPHWDAVWL
jgi:putative transposase